MFPRTKNRRGIHIVLTTMIILVASVVMGTGVTLYGTSLFQTNANTEAITTTGTQVWVDSTLSSGWAWGAADVRNSGDKLLSVDQIQIRGQAVPYANWYANSTVNGISSAQFQAALIYTQMINKNTGVLDNGSSFGTTQNPVWQTMTSCTTTGPNAAMMIQLASGAPICLTQQQGPISLEPGQKAIIYFKMPQNILTSVDAGSASSVALYAGKVGAPQSVTIAAK